MKYLKKMKFMFMSFNKKGEKCGNNSFIFRNYWNSLFSYGNFDTKDKTIAKIIISN